MDCAPHAPVTKTNVAVAIAPRARRPPCCTFISQRYADDLAYPNATRTTWAKWVTPLGNMNFRKPATHSERLCPHY